MNGSDRIGWWYTLFALVPCFAYLITLSLAPGLLATPIGPATRVTLGLVLGLALAALLFVLAAAYTWQINSAERD